MTILADIKWTCRCGHVNTDQLWTLDWDLGDATYLNGEVPTDCELNFVETCRGCGRYTLGHDATELPGGVRRWPVVEGPGDKEFFC